MRKTIQYLGFSIGVLAMFSCNDGTSNENASAENAADTLLADNHKSSEWVSLFDGQTLKGWHLYNKRSDSIANWKIEDSSLVCLGAAEDAHGGDLATDSQYENFEFSWDWKLTKGANSGVMYHVVEDAKYQAPFQTGPEYQMIDDKDFPGKLEVWQKTGADYAMQPASANKKVKPVGEWNTSSIIFNNGHVEHWLNGEKIVEFEAGTEAWKKEKETGKWKDFPDYGSAAKGVIALQDHGNKVYFKNIKIKEL